MPVLGGGGVERLTLGPPGGKVLQELGQVHQFLVQALGDFVNSDLPLLRLVEKFRKSLHYNLVFGCEEL